jgi:tetratricopeptide (TPR) repeat protein
LWARLAAQHPRSVIPHVYAAYDALLKKDRGGFDAALDRARANASGRPHESTAIGTVCLAAAQRDEDPARRASLLQEAVRRLTAGRKGDPSDPAAMLNLGAALHMGGRPAEAIPHLQRYVDRYPLERPVLRRIALCYLEQDEANLALQWAQRPTPGVALGPEDWELIGRCHYMMNQFERAESAYRESLRLDGSRPWSWNNLGLALQEMGRSREAEECFARSRELRAPR